MIARMALTLAIACGLLAVATGLGSVGPAAAPASVGSAGLRVVAPVQTAVPTAVPADVGGAGLGEDPLAIFIAVGLVATFIIGLIISRRRR